MSRRKMRTAPVALSRESGKMIMAAQTSRASHHRYAGEDEIPIAELSIIYGRRA
jgi:hypothetical protein